MIFIETLKEYYDLKSDTYFNFKCNNCNGIFTKRKRRGKRGQTFNFLCQKCGREISNLKKYGFKNVFSSDLIKEKIKNTNILKYNVDSPSKNNYIKEKSRETCLKKYGVEYSFQSKNNKDKTKYTLLKKYNVEYIGQVKEIRNKASKARKKHKKSILLKMEKTCLQKYGVRHFAQSKEAHKHHKSRYFYDNEYFDSSWELAFYIYCKDNNLNIIRNYDSFDYLYNNKTYKYFPDFKIDKKYIEIKGLQFFENKDTTKKMINPYNSLLNEKFEAKHQCMIKNNIIIITDIKKYLSYIKNRYSLDYLNKFLIKKN